MNSHLISHAQNNYISSNLSSCCIVHLIKTQPLACKARFAKAHVTPFVSLCYYQDQMMMISNCSFKFEAGAVACSETTYGTSCRAIGDNMK